MHEAPRFSAARGSFVYDERGNRYLDLICGWGLAPLGWQPPAVIERVVKQIRDLPVAAGGFGRADHEHLVGRLRRVFGSTASVLPAASGTEAVEIALRLARRFTGRAGGVSLRGSFHGSSVATFALCGIAEWRRPVDVAGFAYALLDPRDDGQWDEEIERAFDEVEPACVVVEPLQTNAGFRLLPRRWLQHVASLCRERDVLLVADDVSSGLGRGGSWRGAEIYDVQPDVTVLGKGLGAGVYPIAAVVCAPEIAEAGQGPGFASSFAWSPPGCVAAAATLDEIEQGGLVERAVRLREMVEPQLSQIATLPSVAAVTGVGLGIGIALHEDGRTPSVRLGVRDRLLDEGLRVGVNPVLPGLALMPALTIDEGNLVDALERIGGFLAAT